MTGRRWARVHLVLLLFWAAAVPLAFVFGWAESVVFVSLASIYANMATHWSAMQGANAERVAEESNE